MDSYFRYYSEKADADGTPLHWPGGPGGFPFRGHHKPSLKRDEYEDLRLTGKPRAKVFYLGKEEDLKHYLIVRDSIVNGRYAQVDRDRTWDEATNGPRIFLEWVELGYDLPSPAIKEKMYDGAPPGTENAIPINQTTPLDPGFRQLAGFQDPTNPW